MRFGLSSFSPLTLYDEESEKPRTRSLATNMVERILAEHSEPSWAVDEVGGTGKRAEDVVKVREKEL